MALTEEQIKNLKPGDIVDVRGFVNLPLCNGNIIVEFRYESNSMTLKAYSRISTEFISLPGEPEEKPKYDPCRKFKKGDKANVTYRDGRCFVDSTKVPLLEENVTVVEDEGDSGLVQVRGNSGRKMRVAFFFLKLVSSVEDRMPYSIDQLNTNVLLKDGKKFATFEDDNEAQEVCNRMNAEWLKKQNL